MHLELDPNAHLDVSDPNFHLEFQIQMDNSNHHMCEKQFYKKVTMANTPAR